MMVKQWRRAPLLDHHVMKKYIANAGLDRADEHRLLDQHAIKK